MKKRTVQKFLTLALSAVMALGVMTGCGSEPPPAVRRVPGKARAPRRNPLPRAVRPRLPRAAPQRQVWRAGRRSRTM